MALSVENLGFRANFSETAPSRTLVFCIRVEWNRGYYFSIISYLEKLLIWGLREIRYIQMEYLAIFLRNCTSELSDCLHDVRWLCRASFEYDFISVKEFLTLQIKEDQVSKVGIFFVLDLRRQ